MSDRWIPVFAAFVGVIGGLGGAVIGAAAANENQKRELEEERRDEVQDIRREAYGHYIGIAENIRGGYAAGQKPVEKYIELFAAEAIVSMVGTKEADEAAHAITLTFTEEKDENGTLLSDDQKDKRYVDARKQFLEQVRQDLGTRT